MIKFEELSEEGQKSYKVTNVVRIVVLLLGWAVFVLAVVLSIKRGDGFKTTMITAFVAAGFVPGIVHGEFAYKKTIRILTELFGIIGFIIGLMLSAIWFTIFYFTGFIMFIVDTVLLILRKPLIYPFENIFFYD